MSAGVYACAHDETGMSGIVCLNPTKLSRHTYICSPVRRMGLEDSSSGEVAHT